MDAQQYQVINFGIFVHNGSVILLQAKEVFLKTLTLRYIIVFMNKCYILI